MYLYYLLGWKLMTKYYTRWQTGKDDEKELKAEVQVREKRHTTLRYMVACLTSQCF